MTQSLVQDTVDDDRSVAGGIARALASRIVQGHLPPGEPIRQDHVAAAFKASHVPVREAFCRLEAQGLVVSQPRRGVRVAPLEPRALFEVTQMRVSLEVLALRRAVPKLTAGDIAEAQAALLEAAASDDIAVWEVANRRFHNALMRPCAMPRLLVTIADLQSAAARYLFATWRDFDWQPRSDIEHRALLVAARAGNVEVAGVILRAHILAASETLHNALVDREP